MSEHNLNGINVKFPYDPPYDVQIKFMENVIDSLTNRRHAILESPTGFTNNFLLQILLLIVSLYSHDKIFQFIAHYGTKIYLSLRFFIWYELFYKINTN